MSKIIKIVLSILLLLCLLNMPYGFYQLVRFICFLGFVYLAYQAKQENQKPDWFIFGALALLFQPFMKVSLGRDLWNIIDLLVGIGLFISIFFSKEIKRKKI